MKIKLLTLLLVFSVLFAVPDKELSLEKVHVYFAEKDTRIAQMALETVHAQQKRLIEQYGLDLKPLHIYIANSEDTYKRYAGSGSPVWSAGLASDDRMLVKSPSFSRQSPTVFQKTLLHETVHLAVSGIPLPLWFNEGFARIEAGQFDLRDRVLVSQAFWRGHLMSDRKIGQLNQMDRVKAESAYAQATARVDHLLSYFGVELVGKCLNFSKEYNSFEKGFANAFLMTPSRFETHWLEEAAKSYRYYILLDQRSLWTITPVLLLLGYIMTKIRRRKLMDSWENEEEAETL